MVVRVVAESPALEAVTTAAVAVAPATPPPPGATAASAIIVYPTQRRPRRNFRERILPAGCTGRGKVRGGGAKRKGGDVWLPFCAWGGAREMRRAFCSLALFYDKHRPLRWGACLRLEDEEKEAGIGGWGWVGGRKHSETVTGLHVAGGLTC